MKALILKELRENLKWLPLPGLVILLVFLIEKPDEPMLPVKDAYFFCLIAVVFGAALGFLQVFFEAHGDKRSLLLHRPLSHSRIFLAKALAGVSLYVLALGIPFACLEGWFATPGNLAAPYHWRTGLPWLADILSGLVYYFAGMLAAQREARWYGSRGLVLAAAFFCSYLVWALPEFGQVLMAIMIIGLLVGAAAWDTFCAGGAYAPRLGFAKAALSVTMLAGLLIVSVLGKQTIGEWLDPEMHYQVDIDRHGRVLFSTSQMDGDEMVTDLDGQVVDLRGERHWRSDATFLEYPKHWTYRNNSRFYVECKNESRPGNERWYYDHAQGRLLGYDKYFHQLLGSFGPDGFTPEDQPPAGTSISISSLGKRTNFEGELRYGNNRWGSLDVRYLTLPGRVYVVDFARRALRILFTPDAGENVTCARRWSYDEDENKILVIVSTDKSFHVLTEKGMPVISFPREFDPVKYGFVFVGHLENPDRYFVWYQLTMWLREPQEYQTSPSQLIEYNSAGGEFGRRTVPPFPYPSASYAEALFGLVTPMTEAATLVGASQFVRSWERLKGGTQKSSALDFLEGSQYFIPGTYTLATTFSPAKAMPGGLIPGYFALMLLSALGCALGCFLLARRYAFSRARRGGWAVLGFLFGWVGLALMLVIQEWPARVACPKCRKLRVVTRKTCEHCGTPHTMPAADGTEIFATASMEPHVGLTGR